MADREQQVWRLRQWIKGWRVPFGLLVILSLVVGGMGCSGALYYPTHFKHFDPEKSGAAPRELWIRTPDNSVLYGWWFQTRVQSKPKAFIVHFHGNGENISSHFLYLQWIVEQGYDVLEFDYRGYGRSTGEPSPEGTIIDGKAALRRAQILATDRGTSDIIVFGQSLGGAIALRTVAELVQTQDPISKNICGVAIDSSFESYRAEGADVLASHWLTWWLQPLAYVLLSDTAAPVGGFQYLINQKNLSFLLVHGDQDRTVPLERGLKLYDGLRNGALSIEQWIIPGGEHTDFLFRENGKYRSDFVLKLAEMVNRKKQENSSAQEQGPHQK